jgi:hypothetical protein
MGLIRIYANFLAKNPVFGLYAIGATALMGYMIYEEISDKMRADGERLAK